MTWRTHMAVGANAIWLAGLTGHVDGSLLVLLPVACIASILPDIDAAGRGAKIHHMGGGIFRTFAGTFYGKYFHHRGLMHSVFVAFILYLVLFFFFHDSMPLVPLVAAVAYFSHPIVDGLNQGVGYLFPFSTKKFALVPRVFQTRVGGHADDLLFYVGLFCLAIFFLTYGLTLLPTSQSSFILGVNQ